MLPTALTSVDGRGIAARKYALIVVLAIVAIGTRARNPWRSLARVGLRVQAVGDASHDRGLRAERTAVAAGDAAVQRPAENNTASGGELARDASIPQLASWPRVRFQPGGGNAHLFFKVHGTFHGPPEISRSRHRFGGLPAGCTLEEHTRATHPDVLAFGLDDGYIGREFRRRDRALFATAEASDQCVVLSCEVADPRTLDYLRDAVGLVMALMESGGVAVFDPHMFRWWNAAEWRERAFEPSPLTPAFHVVILVSDEPTAGLRWYHTRGMIKFGRPDLGFHNVPAALDASVRNMLERFIELQAQGGVVAEGQEITRRSLPAGLRCRHAGNLHDPEFNNRHIEIGPR